MENNDTSENIKRFDSWAKTYDTDRISSWFRYIHKMMLEHIDISGKKKILDVGCGTGNALALMAKENREAEYYGIDISAQMIKNAREKTGNLANFEFKIANSENIPYKDNSFHLVFSSNSFHHYPNPLKALKEIKRVLKDGGTFFLEDACRDVFFPIWLQNIYRQKFEKGHIKYYTTSEITGFLKEAGFKHIKIVKTLKGIGIKKKAFTGIGMFSARK